MRLTVIALSLVVSGAATAVAQTAKQTQTPRTGHCDVGVVSNLGKFTFYDESPTGRGWAGRVEMPIESWHLDEVVVERIRAALGNRMAVQGIPYRVYVPPSMRQLAGGTRCARYVEVEKDRVTDVDTEFEGIGFYKNLFGSHLYVVITVTVYDGETFKPLLLNPGTSARGRAPDSVSPDSAIQNAKLREATRQVLVRSLDEELSTHYNLGLTPTLKELLLRAPTAAP